MYQNSPCYTAPEVRVYYATPGSVLLLSQIEKARQDDYGEF